MRTKIFIFVVLILTSFNNLLADPVHVVTGLPTSPVSFSTLRGAYNSLRASGIPDTDWLIEIDNNSNPPYTWTGSNWSQIYWDFDAGSGSITITTDSGDPAILDGMYMQGAAIIFKGVNNIHVTNLYFRGFINMDLQFTENAAAIGCSNCGYSLNT